MSDESIEQIRECEMEPKQVIYQHYNTISMKSYIGLTTRGMNERWKEHLWVAFRTNDDGSFTHTAHFHKAIRKYPLDSWVHIELYQYKNDGTELPIEEYEKFFIAKFDTYKKGYNSTLGGDGCSGLTGNGKAVRAGMVATRSDSVKGYTWDKRHKSWGVSLTCFGKTLYFGNFKLEVDAKTRADYILSLVDEDLLIEYEEYKASKKYRTKGYYFNKEVGMYQVQLTIDGKKKSFGCYTTEEEAINKVKEVRDGKY